MSKPKRTILWLNEVGVFEIIPNLGDGNCLFRAIAQALSHPKFEGEEPHAKIRKKIVSYIVRKNWKTYSPQILQRWRKPLEGKTKAPLSEKSVRQKFAKIMSSFGESGTLNELAAGGDVFQFHWDYLTMSNREKRLYKFFSCRTNGCKARRTQPRFIFYFSRYRDGSGHWELLRPILTETPGPFPLNRKIFGFPVQVQEKRMSSQSNEPHSSRKSDDVAVLIAKEIQKRVKELDLIPEDDIDWPGDDIDDRVGCCALNFKPKARLNLLRRLCSMY